MAKPLFQSRTARAREVAALTEWLGAVLRLSDDFTVDVQEPPTRIDVTTHHEPFYDRPFDKRGPAWKPAHLKGRRTIVIRVNGGAV